MKLLASAHLVAVFKTSKFMLAAWRQLSSVNKAATVLLAASAGSLISQLTASPKHPVGFSTNMSWQAHGKI